MVPCLIFRITFGEPSYRSILGEKLAGLGHKVLGHFWY